MMIWFVLISWIALVSSTEILQANGALDESLLTELFSLPLLTEDEIPNRYSCPSVDNPSRTLNNFHIRGTALGGWLVLEPWITPSLFYQFLGASKKWGDDAKNHVGLDSITFCTALGKKEANRQLRNHWRTWVTEEQIARLASTGVTHLRIPVADWMFTPYEPFIGCWDGALEELDRVLSLCESYNISALLDLHAVRGSQNGLDNSGDTSHYRWIGNATSDGVAIYDHWSMRGADWVGVFNNQNDAYDSINETRVISTLKVIDTIVETYKGRPVVMGLEMLNEPWDRIPFAVLKEFYWRCYKIVQIKAPHWLSLFHDSFRLTPEYFGDFLVNCDNWALDTHIYQAWAWVNPPEWFQQHACLDSQRLRAMEDIGVPVIVGEWSLATDNCAMWLNGLNDNVPGYPKVACEMIRCPDPYMGLGVQPNAPPDPTQGAQDPFGTGGVSTVEYGLCPRDKPFAREIEDVRILAHAKLHAFDYMTHGQFFWNFRTELENRWDYSRAVELGWLPKDMESHESKEILKHGCDAFLSATDLAEEKKEMNDLQRDTASNTAALTQPTASSVGSAVGALVFLTGGLLLLVLYYVTHLFKNGSSSDRSYFPALLAVAAETLSRVPEGNSCSSCRRWWLQNSYYEYEEITELSEIEQEETKKMMV